MVLWRIFEDGEDNRNKCNVTLACKSCHFCSNASKSFNCFDISLWKNTLGIRTSSSLRKNMFYNNLLTIKGKLR